MALAGVKCTVCSDAGDLLIGRDLVEQFGQHGRVAHVAGGELGSPDSQRLLVNSEVDLAPDLTFRAAVLASVPLPFTLGLDPGAVDQDARPRAGSKGDGDGQTFLAARQGAEVRHRPIEPGKLQQARHQPGRLLRRQPKQRLQRQARLNCGVGNRG